MTVKLHHDPRLLTVVMTITARVNLLRAKDHLVMTPAQGAPMNHIEAPVHLIIQLTQGVQANHTKVVGPLNILLH